MARDLNLKALDLAPAIESFAKLGGDRPVMLSYRIGKVVEELDALRQAFMERIQPYVDERGCISADLNDDELSVVTSILEEELVFDGPEITLEELSSLTVSEDAAIFHLTRTGIVSV